MKTFAWTLAAGAALLTQTPSTAEACSCVDPRSETSLLAPSDGAVDVPLNTRIWIGAKFGIDTFELRDSRDAKVESALSFIDGGNARMHVLSPKAALEPSSTYHVVVDGVSLVSFTTGADRDETAPARPAVTSQASKIYEPDGYDSCGPSYATEFQLTGEGLLTVMVQEGTVFNPNTVSGAPLFVSYEASGTPSLGRSGCFTNWPDAERGASKPVRFGSFDLAGNFSGLTDPIEAKIPSSGSEESRERGCQSAGGAVALALLGLVARRRLT
jgi:hypothetical protein